MTQVPRLLGLSTTVPPYRLRQADVIAQAHGLFAGGPPEDLERLLPVYLNAGIETRYSCVPLEWYTRPHGWAEKNRLYLENAVALLETATLDCLARAGLGVGDVDMVVSVSTSGIATPSLDALLAERLDMRRDVQRLPVFGLGCAGGVLGLARAAAMAQASLGATVLFLVVELCALTFRRGDRSKSNIIATALFGDGAAAAVVSCRAGEEQPDDTQHQNNSCGQAMAMAKQQRQAADHQAEQHQNAPATADRAADLGQPGAVSDRRGGVGEGAHVDGDRDPVQNHGDGRWHHRGDE